MWQRRTIHDVAAELSSVCERFRMALRGDLPSVRSSAERRQVMLDESRTGSDLLRILALTIRPEQDSGDLDRSGPNVGVVSEGIDSAMVPSLLRPDRRVGFGMPGFHSLNLRGALNKIAHAHPGETSNGFYVDGDAVHDLILSGARGRNTWVAVISLLDLCREVMGLPDCRAVGVGPLDRPPS